MRWIYQPRDSTELLKVTCKRITYHPTLPVYTLTLLLTVEPCVHLLSPWRDTIPIQPILLQVIPTILQWQNLSAV